MCKVIHYKVKRKMARTKHGLFKCSANEVCHSRSHRYTSFFQLDHYHRLSTLHLGVASISVLSFSSTAIQNRNCPAMCKIKSHLDIHTSSFVGVDVLPRNDRTGHEVYGEDRSDGWFNLHMNLKLTRNCCLAPTALSCLPSSLH